MTHRGGPVALLLTRQGVPVVEGPASVDRGGYVLADAEDSPELVIMASGSEVSVALEAREILGKDKVRVVSMPSPGLFLEQDEAYRDSVIPSRLWARMAIEAGVDIIDPVQAGYRFMPACTAGMYCLGMMPPLVMSAN